MGLFSLRQKKGSGILKDAPRKKGLLRFFELISRDFRDMLLVNLLFFVCALPSIALFALSIFGVFPPGLYLSVPAAFPVGGGMTACLFSLTRLMRDEPGYVFDDFKRKFRENMRSAAVAGIVLTTFIYTQLFMFWVPVFADWETAGTAWIIAAIVIFLFVSMIAPYVFLHYAYIRLGTFTILKNSILLALSNILRSLAGAVSGLLPWLALLAFYPITVVLFPLIPFVMFVLSWLLSLMWVWPVFNSHFSVEETLRRK